MKEYKEYNKETQLAINCLEQQFLDRTWTRGNFVSALGYLINKYKYKKKRDDSKVRK